MRIIVLTASSFQFYWNWWFWHELNVLYDWTIKIFLEVQTHIFASGSPTFNRGYRTGVTRMSMPPWWYVYLLLVFCICIYTSNSLYFHSCGMKIVNPLWLFLLFIFHSSAVIWSLPESIRLLWPLLPCLYIIICFDVPSISLVVMSRQVYSCNLAFWTCWSSNARLDHLIVKKLSEGFPIRSESQNHMPKIAQKLWPQSQDHNFMILSLFPPLMSYPLPYLLPEWAGMLHLRSHLPYALFLSDRHGTVFSFPSLPVSVSSRAMCDNNTLQHMYHVSYRDHAATLKAILVPGTASPT